MSDDKIYTQMGKQMYNEIIEIVERYARQVEKSDLKIDVWKVETAYMIAHLIAGILPTCRSKKYREGFIKLIVQSADTIIKKGNIKNVI